MAWIWKNVAGGGNKEGHIVVSATLIEKNQQAFGDSGEDYPGTISSISRGNMSSSSEPAKSSVGNTDGTLSKCPWVNRMNKLKLIIKLGKEAEGDGHNRMVNQSQTRASDVVQNVRQRFFPLKPWQHFHKDLLKPQQHTYDGNKDELPWHSLDGQRNEKNGQE